jgi:hypothetical protein
MGAVPLTDRIGRHQVGRVLEWVTTPVRETTARATEKEFALTPGPSPEGRGVKVQVITGKSAPLPSGEGLRGEGDSLPPWHWVIAFSPMVGAQPRAAAAQGVQARP